jgi:hypothetical protein
MRVSGIANRTLIAISICVLSACSISDDRGIAEKAVTEFHQMLNASHFDTVYSNAARDLKDRISKTDFVELLQRIHRTLGNSLATQQQTWKVNYNLSGTFAWFTYKTTFQGGVVTEQFTYRISGKTARLAGYYIQMDTLGKDGETGV